MGGPALLTRLFLCFVLLSSRAFAQNPAVEVGTPVGTFRFSYRFWWYPQDFANDPVAGAYGTITTGQSQLGTPVPLWKIASVDSNNRLPWGTGFLLGRVSESQLSAINAFGYELKHLGTASAYITALFPDTPATQYNLPSDDFLAFTMRLHCHSTLDPKGPSSLLAEQPYTWRQLKANGGKWSQYGITATNVGPCKMVRLAIVPIRFRLDTVNVPIPQERWDLGASLLSWIVLQHAIVDIQY